MSKGIYKYTDLKTGEIVYIGKDSHIDKHSRHKNHLSPSAYDKQPINKILQNNPNRYGYSVIWSTEDCTTLKLNKMEILFGNIYNPKFNFGKYGAGGHYKLSDEHKQKISESLTGIKRSDEHKRKTSENNARYWKGKSPSNETRKKIGDAITKNYARITKYGYSNQKKIRYCIRYNKKVVKSSINIHKLIDWWNENYPTEPLHVEVNKE